MSGADSVLRYPIRNAGGKPKERVRERTVISLRIT
jgi:hypothetical protein